MEKTNYKLLKSFVLIKDVNSSKRGDVFFLEKHQANIPIEDRHLYFQNQKSGQALSMKWFMENNGFSAKPNDFFETIEEKFEHIL